MFLALFMDCLTLENGIDGLIFACVGQLSLYKLYEHEVLSL
jgi:hypothetical protein